MIKLVVNGQNLYRYSTERILADGSVQFVEFEFEFSSEWESMEKTAQFIQGEKVYSVVLTDDKCYLPAEVTEGTFFITVFGYAGERRGTTRKLQEVLYDSGFGQGEVPVPPTPDLYAQLMVKIDEAVEEAKGYADEAKQSVDDARQAVSNMEASAETVPYGTPASVTKTLNEAGAVVLKFNIPQGPPGPAGAGVPPITEQDEGKFLGVFDGKTVWLAGGAGSGNVASPEIYTIRTLDLEEYNNLEQKDRNTLYLIKG